MYTHYRLDIFVKKSDLLYALGTFLLSLTCAVTESLQSVIPSEDILTSPTSFGSHSLEEVPLQHLTEKLEVNNGKSKIVDEETFKNYASASMGSTASSSGEGCFEGVCAEASQAIDDDDKTFWAESGCGGKPSNSSHSWLLIDLGRDREIAQVWIGAHFDMTYAVQVWNASSASPRTVGFRQCTGCEKGSEVGHGEATFSFPSTAVRYIKVDITFSARGGGFDACGESCCIWGTAIWSVHAFPEVQNYLHPRVIQRHPRPPAGRRELLETDNCATLNAAELGADGSGWSNEEVTNTGSAGLVHGLWGYTVQSVWKKFDLPQDSGTTYCTISWTSWATDSRDNEYNYLSDVNEHESNEAWGFSDFALTACRSRMGCTPALKACPAVVEGQQVFYGLLENRIRFGSSLLKPESPPPPPPPSPPPSPPSPPPSIHTVILDPESQLPPVTLRQGEVWSTGLMIENHGDDDLNVEVEVDMWTTKLLSNYEASSKHGGPPIIPLAMGHYSSIKVVWRGGWWACTGGRGMYESSCGADHSLMIDNTESRSPFRPWQACPSSCHNFGEVPYSFELKLNNQYILEQPDWGTLPPQCSKPLTYTGDIICDVDFVVSYGDTLTVTWYEASHSSSSSSSDNDGTIIVDLFAECHPGVVTSAQASSNLPQSITQSTPWTDIGLQVSVFAAQGDKVLLTVNLNYSPHGDNHQGYLTIFRNGVNVIGGYEYDELQTIRPDAGGRNQIATMTWLDSPQHTGIAVYTVKARRSSSFTLSEKGAKRQLAAVVLHGKAGNREMQQPDIAAASTIRSVYSYISSTSWTIVPGIQASVQTMSPTDRVLITINLNMYSRSDHTIGRFTIFRDGVNVNAADANDGLQVAYATYSYSWTDVLNLRVDAVTTREFDKVLLLVNLNWVPTQTWTDECWLTIFRDDTNLNGPGNAGLQQLGNRESGRNQPATMTFLDTPNKAGNYTYRVKARSHYGHTFTIGERHGNILSQIAAVIIPSAENISNSAYQSIFKPDEEESFYGLDHAALSEVATSPMCSPPSIEWLIVNSTNSTIAAGQQQKFNVLFSATNPETTVGRHHSKLTVTALNAKTDFEGLPARIDAELHVVEAHYSEDLDEYEVWIQTAPPQPKSPPPLLNIPPIPPPPPAPGANESVSVFIISFDEPVIMSESEDAAIKQGAADFPRSPYYHVEFDAKVYLPWFGVGLEAEDITELVNVTNGYVISAQPSSTCKDLEIDVKGVLELQDPWLHTNTTVHVTIPHVPTQTTATFEHWPVVELYAMDTLASAHGHCTDKSSLLVLAHFSETITGLDADGFVLGDGVRVASISSTPNTRNTYHVLLEFEADFVGITNVGLQRGAAVDLCGNPSLATPKLGLFRYPALAFSQESAFDINVNAIATFTARPPSSDYDAPQPSAPSTGTSNAAAFFDNGAGYCFKLKNNGRSNFEIAQKACESVYGKCKPGQCGSFHYWYGDGHLSCDCNKAAGQYEFVYQNDDSSFVGDIDCARNTGSVAGKDMFVRQKATSGCASGCWQLALVNLGSIPCQSADMYRNNYQASYGIHSYSSCHSHNRCVNRLNDGNTVFGSGGRYDLLWNPRSSAWIIFDLYSPKTLRTITTYAQNEYSDCSREVTGFRLSYSSDGSTSNFVTALEATRGSGCKQTSSRQSPNPGVDTFDILACKASRYWKLEVTDTFTADFAQYFGFMEIVLHANMDPSTTCSDHDYYYRTTSSGAYGAGWNEYGQLGNMKASYGDYSSQYIFQSVSSVFLDEGETIVSVAAGQDSSFFLTSGSNVMASGADHYGQLGIGSQYSRNALTKTVDWLPSKVVDIQAAGEHAFFLLTGGRVFATGSNGYYQLGRIHDSSRLSTPREVMPEHEVTKIRTAQENTFFFVAGGSVYGVGRNRYGEHGDGNTGSKSAPTQLVFAFNGSVIDITCGQYYAFFLTAGLETYAAGYTYYSNLGDGYPYQYSRIQQMPVQVMKGYDIVQVAIPNENFWNGVFTIFRSKDGKVYGVGYNYDGQLGDGTRTERSIPVELFVGSNVTIADVVVSRKNSYFITTDGALYGCGDNSYGQLGSGLESNSNTKVLFPRAIYLNGVVVDVAAGQYHVLVVVK
ncbi:hypothetical protein CYMTET_3074 [Cymbomonas tetramitiformis]|uniref:Uncharacterized protein n=1 Tax=Cymbomonas tetramitiformis TaxID=36881 RepID=A0AAE0LL74_9CHLO|nr:hypothetical protein CYMTET_3074 [Cymbomonas tetramitiformis]